MNGQSGNVNYPPLWQKKTHPVLKDSICVAFFHGQRDMVITKSDYEMYIWEGRSRYVHSRSLDAV